MENTVWGVFFNLAYDKIMGSGPLACSLTPLQWCSASTAPCFWGLSVVGALKLVPCWGRFWLSWRFHGGDFIASVFHMSSAGGQWREESTLSTQGWQRFPAREVPHHFSQALSRHVHSHANLVSTLRKSPLGPHAVWASNASMKLLLKIDHRVFPAWGVTALSQAQLPMQRGNGCPKQTPSSS